MNKHIFYYQICDRMFVTVVLQLIFVWLIIEDYSVIVLNLNNEITRAIKYNTKCRLNSWWGCCGRRRGLVARLSHSRPKSIPLRMPLPRKIDPVGFGMTPLPDHHSITSGVSFLFLSLCSFNGSVSTGSNMFEHIWTLGSLVLFVAIATKVSLQKSSKHFTLESDIPWNEFENWVPVCWFMSIFVLDQFVGVPL